MAVVQNRCISVCFLFSWPIHRPIHTSVVLILQNVAAPAPVPGVAHPLHVIPKLQNWTKPVLPIQPEVTSRGDHLTQLNIVRTVA